MLGLLGPALEGNGERLAQAYAAYCREHRLADPLPSGQWIKGFERAGLLGRGRD